MKQLGLFLIVPVIAYTLVLMMMGPLVGYVIAVLVGLFALNKRIEQMLREDADWMKGWILFVGVLMIFVVGWFVHQNMMASMFIVGLSLCLLAVQMDK